MELREVLDRQTEILDIFDNYIEKNGDDEKEINFNILIDEYFDNLKYIKNEFRIKTAIYRYVDLINKIDKVAIEYEKDNFINLLEIENILKEEYDKFIDKNIYDFIDFNKHYYFNKATLFEVIEREHKNGFKYSNTTINVKENSEIPELRDDFVGRTEKAIEIIDKLTVPRKVSLCLSGETLGDNGGIGKTTLATHIAHFLSNTDNTNDQFKLNLSDKYDYLKNHFEDGIIWVNVSYANTDIEDVIESIANQIGKKYFRKRKEEKYIESEKKSYDKSDDLASNFNTPDQSKEPIIVKNDKLQINNDIFENQDKDEVTTVWHLEEIAVILNNKKVLVVIDNEEQNRSVFEYIYPRLNGFVTILITSRLRKPGIDHVLIENLNKEDSINLFKYNKVKFLESNSFKSVNHDDEAISNLTYDVLEGHPFSINFAARSPELYSIGIKDFSGKLKYSIENCNDIQNSTYRKVFSTIILGNVLNPLEYKVLLRGGCNFETTFSKEDLNAFCPYDDFEKGIQSLYEKSILRKDEKNNKYIVQQILKDFAKYFIASEYITRERIIKKDYNLEESSILDVDWVDKYKIISILEKLEISNIMISNILAKNFLFNEIEYAEQLNKVCTNYIYLLDSYDHNSNELQLYAARVFQMLPSLKKLYPWFKMVEIGGLNDLKYHKSFLEEGTKINRAFQISNDRWTSDSIYRWIASSYIKLSTPLNVDYIISSFSSKIKNKFNLKLKFNIDVYLSLDEILPFLTRQDSLKLSKILLNERYKTDSRNGSIYFEHLTTYTLNKLINNKILDLHDKSTLLNFSDDNNLSKLGIEFIALLEKFYLNDNFIADDENFNFDLVNNYKEDIIALKAISLFNKNNLHEAKEVIADQCLKNESPKLHNILLKNKIAKYSTEEIANQIVDEKFDENDDFSKALLNYPKMIYIPEGKVFKEVSKSILLDEKYLVENAYDLINGNYDANIFQEKDFGVILYPYLITKEPITEEEYIKFCREKNKDINLESFSILNAIQYAEANHMKVATEMEVIKAFNGYNFNIGINPKDYIEKYETLLKETILDDSKSFENHIEFLIPKELSIINESLDIEKTINQIKLKSKQKVFDIPIEIVRLIAYSTTIDTPKLKHQAIEKLKNSTPDKFDKIYSLLIKDFLINMSYSVQLEDELLLQFITQRNFWKIALKLKLNIDAYFETPEFSNEVEMVYSEKDEKALGEYRVISKGKIQDNIPAKSGFVPFRCVKPLPLNIELLFKTEGYAI